MGSSEIAQHRAQADDRVLLRRYRNAVESDYTPPKVTAEVLWCDNVLHGLDIRHPMGLRYPGSKKTLTRAAESLTTMTWPSRTACRSDGLQFAATDIKWSVGTGPQVAGPIEEILLAIAGRRLTNPALNGEGVRFPSCSVLSAPGRNRTYDPRFRNEREWVSASHFESHLTCSASVFSSSGLVVHHAVARGGWTSGWTSGWTTLPPTFSGRAGSSQRPAEELRAACSRRPWRSDRRSCSQATPTARRDRSGPTGRCQSCARP